VQASARTAGLWGLQTPEEYGGANLGAVMNALIAMELGRTLVNFQFGGGADNILFGGTEEQKQRYLVPTIEGQRRSCFALSEPNTGSDATNIETRAVRDGGDWIINGQKTWISGAHDADFAIVFFLTDPDKRARGGITAFLIDREMGWTERPIALMSSWEASDMWFDNVRVPGCNVLGEVGDGFGLAMQWIGRGRLNIPARAVGQGQGLLQLGLDYARQRKAFGQPIAEFSGAQMVFRVADRMLQVHGGMGYTRELPIERILREVRVYRIFEGTDEIQKRTIARNLLRDYVRLDELA